MNEGRTSRLCLVPTEPPDERVELALALAIRMPAPRNKRGQPRKHLFYAAHHGRSGWPRSKSKPSGPDLAQGIALAELADGGELSNCQRRAGAAGPPRRGHFAIGPDCTHYNAPLVDGLVVVGTLRCPCIMPLSISAHRRGRPPTGIECARVLVGRETRRQDLRAAEAIAVGGEGPRRASGRAAGDIVIIGGGGAGFAAAEMLRRQQFQGRVVVP